MGDGSLDKDSSDLDGNTGFASLVGPDLNTYEQAVTARLANLSVVGEKWTQSEMTDEPQSYQSDSPEGTIVVLEEPEKATENTEDSTWKLGPDEIMQLLIQEFGPLAAPGETEEFIVETDGAMFKDVIILVSSRGLRF